MTFDSAAIETIYGKQFVKGNNVKLLARGKESFEAIFRSIEEATRFICLEFYIFRNDETGTEMAELLKKKTRENIKVYILYDHFGSLGTPGKFWNDLKTAGIALRASRPLKWLSPLHYVHRDHRKLIIIDGLKAFTGGLNIADEYRGFHIRTRKIGWRDTALLLEGPIVSELFKTFKKSWKIWKGKDIPFEAPADKRLMAHSSSNAKEADEALPVLPIISSSSKGRRMMRRLLYYSINHSNKNMQLTTAYFTPSRHMLNSLEEAVKRGVEVKLLLPGNSDVPAAHHSGRAFYLRLLRAGVKIYNYQGEMLHAKSYLFDNCWSIVGSANLDSQSLRWNDEGNVGILDRGFGEKMIEIFEEDLMHSVEIKEEEWIKRPMLDRIKERFFVLFRRRL